MIEQKDNHVFLSQLLNEFYDDLSYFFLMSQEKMREGLKLTLSYNEHGAYVVPCEHPYKQEPILIERIRNIESWFLSQVKINNLITFNSIIENHQYSSFTDIIVFDGDEFVFTFSQGKKMFEHRIVLSTSCKIRNNLDNMYLKLKLEKLGFRVDTDIDLTIKLNNNSSLRSVLMNNINLMSDSGDKFFNYFYQSLLKKFDEISKIALETTNISPKSFYSLYILCMKRGLYKAKAQPDGFVQQVLKNERQELSDFYIEQFEIFNKKMNYIEFNRMPFCSLKK